MTYDESGRAARCRVVTALLAVALIVLVGANLCIGSVLVPADHIPGILSGGAANSMESRLLMALAELPQIMEVARVIAGERPVQLVDNVGGGSHLLVHVGACDPDVAVLHGFELRQ